jgi:hypothetical protein
MLGANSNDDAHGSMIAGADADTGADAGTVADTVAVAVTEDLRAVQPPTCPPSN